MKKRPFVEKRARALRDRDFHVLALGYYLWESPSAQTVRIPVDYASWWIIWKKLWHFFAA